eukprot:356209-Chlamydomonas_euryale.AAC.3
MPAAVAAAAAAAATKEAAAAAAAGATTAAAAAAAAAAATTAASTQAQAQQQQQQHTRTHNISNIPCLHSTNNNISNMPCLRSTCRCLCSTRQTRFWAIASTQTSLGSTTSSPSASRCGRRVYEVNKVVKFTNSKFEHASRSG